MNLIKFQKQFTFKKYLSTLILIVFGSTIIAFGQNSDKIYLKSKEVISGNILRITAQNIELDPEGDKPFIIIKRKDVNVIIYKDNTVVQMNSEDGITESDTASKANNLMHGLRTDGFYIARQFYSLKDAEKSMVKNLFFSHTYTNYYWPAFSISSNIEDHKLNFSIASIAQMSMERAFYKKIVRKNEGHITFEQLMRDYITKSRVKAQLISSKSNMKKNSMIYYHRSRRPFLFYENSGVQLFICELEIVDKNNVRGKVFIIDKQLHAFNNDVKRDDYDIDIIGTTKSLAQISNVNIYVHTKPILFEFVPFD